MDKYGIITYLDKCMHCQSAFVMLVTAVRTLAYWPLNMEHQTTDITGHGFNLTNAGVLFNETRGVSLGPNSGILFLDTTSGPRLQLLHDFTLTFWLLCETDGGFIQWLDLTENQQLESVG